LRVPNIVDPDTSRIEDHTVVGIRHGADRLHRPANRRVVCGTETEEVDVAGGPKLLPGPDQEERCAFEGEAIYLARKSQAKEEALDGVALEHEVEIHSLLARPVQEALPHGGGDVADLLRRRHAVSTSR
jgi:hypothetical protein